MDLRSGYPYWLVAHGLPQTYPPLASDIGCDVAIIGAGITGALIAHHLIDAGLDTVVLDKRDVAWGSTSATTGLIQYEIDTPLRELAGLVGEDHAVRSYRAAWSAIDKLEAIALQVGAECGFRRRQSVQLASRKEDVTGLRDEHALRKRHGFRVEWLSDRDLRGRFPFRKPGALLTHDAADIDPYAMTYALLARGTKYGLRVFDRTEVMRFEPAGAGIRLHTDRGHVATADHVVFATGYESEQYLKHRVGQLVSTYAIASEPLESLDAWFEQCLIWETANPYLYLRTTIDGRAMIGGEDEDFVDARRRDRLIARKARVLERKFRRLFPSIAFETAFAWAGTFAHTKDGLPYIDRSPEMENTNVALCYGGNGITYAVLAGEIIRDQILGNKNENADLFRFGR